MTDERLLARLRGHGNKDTIAAADRIEALLNLNEALVELMDDRDAELAKAVQAAYREGWSDGAAVREYDHRDQNLDWKESQARATLAEIEGEKT
jgi:hypothetical protein